MIDEYNTIVIPYKKFIKDNGITSKLDDVIERTHILTCHAYNVLKLFYLEKYQSGKDLPPITEDFIKMIFKSLVVDSKGPKPKDENLLLFTELREFYHKKYSLLGLPNLMNGTNLSAIINYQTTEMVTSVENNIKNNFKKYINRFVNFSFRKEYKILEKLTSKEKSSYLKKLNKELINVKKDLMDNTLLSEEKYHKWINETKNKILPTEYEKSYQYDIVKNPQKYIRYMIYMNLEIEKDGSNSKYKMFHVFPLRKTIYAKNCTFDTKALIDILYEDKADYLKDIHHCKHDIWKKYFKLDLPIFKESREYKFNYMIKTDCVSVSVNFIHKDSLLKLDNKKGKMKLGREKARIEYKDLSRGEVKCLREQKNKKIEVKTEKKSKSGKKVKEIEFPYLEELTEQQIQELKSNEYNLVFSDPGKRVLHTMKDIEGKKLRYTNKQRLYETKRLKLSKELNTYKYNNGILKTENKLTEFNSKSCNFEVFSKYVKMKNKIAVNLFRRYQDGKFRKYKFYSYINTKRSEDNFLNRIEEVFGKKTIIIMGDWSVSKQMRNFIPTPMIGLKRKIASRFSVYNIWEFRTSCLNSKTETLCENLYIKDKEGNPRKLHSVLTYQMENKRTGCINRDYNSVENMKKITKYWLEHGRRPEKFTREYMISEKDTNQLPLKEESQIVSGLQPYLKKSKIKKSKSVLVKGKSKIKKSTKVLIKGKIEKQLGKQIPKIF